MCVSTTCIELREIETPWIVRQRGHHWFDLLAAWNWILATWTLSPMVCTGCWCLAHVCVLTFSGLCKETWTCIFKVGRLFTQLLHTWIEIIINEKLWQRSPFTLDGLEKVEEVTCVQGPWQGLHHSSLSCYSKTLGPKHEGKKAGWVRQACVFSKGGRSVVKVIRAPWARPPVLSIPLWVWPLFASSTARLPQTVTMCPRSPWLRICLWLRTAMGWTGCAGGWGMWYTFVYMPATSTCQKLLQPGLI